MSKPFGYYLCPSCGEADELVNGQISEKIIKNDRKLLQVSDEIIHKHEELKRIKESIYPLDILDSSLKRLKIELNKSLDLGERYRIQIRDLNDKNKILAKKLNIQVGNNKEIVIRNNFYRSMILNRSGFILQEDKENEI
ncbi:MAG: hypothetical protein RIQ94_180 [Pseudomonadota bacterium]|jgi:hypothetical protein